MNGNMYVFALPKDSAMSDMWFPNDLRRSFWRSSFCKWGTHRDFRVQWRKREGTAQLLPRWRLGQSGQTAASSCQSLGAAWRPYQEEDGHTLA
jgi:hypothetical protein